MKSGGENAAHESREVRLYRLMGVAYVKKLLLRLEKVKYGKTKEKNANYHPKTMSTSALLAFRGHLLYNTLLHLVSSLFLALMVVLMLALRYRPLWMMIVAAVALVVNGYCILLQRYTFLRIKAILRRRQKQEENDRAQRMPLLIKRAAQVLPEQRQLVSSFLDRLWLCTQTGGVCRIEAADFPALKILAQTVEGVCEYEPLIGSPTTARPKEFPLTICNRTDCRVEKLQKALRVKPSETVLFEFSVVTESAQLEALYSRVFPAASRDKLELAVEVLIAAFADGENGTKG